MAKVLKNTAGRVIGVVLALLLLFGVAFAFVGCESNYPQIRITIQFNDNDSDTDDEYVLNYRLNRKIYKQTVTHYLELIEAKFFDGTVIHDYQSNRMVGGGYTYGDLKGDDYRDLVSLAEDYNALTLTPSVWKDNDREEEMNTLYGEVTANGFDIDGEGAYTNEKGALGTYTYLERADAPVGDVRVFGRASSNEEVRNVPYLYNAVTSMFYLYTGSSASADSNFCVFGVLADDDSKTRFDELLSAIDAYETAEQEEDEEYTFTEEMSEEEIADPMTLYGSYTPEFNVPKVKIVIESIVVTNY